MKIFYFHGKNQKTLGGMSSKIWKIERRGCEVHTWYGSVDLIRLKPTVRGKLRTRIAAHDSEEEARAEEVLRIRAQLAFIFLLAVSNAIRL